MPGATAGTFDGLRVIEIAEGVAGPLAARLLSDFGADVIKVEPPVGDRARGLVALGADASGIFEYANWNKRSVTLDLESDADRQVLRRLLGEADVLIESLAPGRLAALGLGYETLAARNPGLVVTSVTPFGQDGPLAGWKSDEIVEWAAGGYMYFGGDPARPPLLIPGYQAQHHAAQAAAVATLAALRYRATTGLGQHIDQSIQEATLGSHAWNSVSWTHTGTVMRRAGSDLFRCRDGWVMLMRRANEPNLFVLMDRPELLDDPRYADRTAWMDPASEIWTMFAEWALTQDKLAIYHAAQALRIALTPVQTMADLLASEQMAERGFFVEVDTQAAGPVRMPGFPYHFGELAPAVRRPAPRLGEHTQEIRAGASWTTNGHGDGADAPPAPSRGAADPTPRALDGLNVLEVTANWAGPLAGRHLGDLGAEVIKVEYAQRPATRALWYPGNDPGARPYNRAGYFNHLNRNKKDVCIDLGNPAGRELFMRLVERADVLIENNSARVMPNLGLGWEQLRERNPRLVMVSVSGFGASGPEQHYVAYGANIEASCGLASVTGYGDGQPFRAGTFYADPVAANYATIAIFVALAHRDRTGRGQWIDISLNECGVTFFGGELVDHQLTGAPSVHRGNRHAVYAPQGAYRSAGDDAWLALTVRDADEWRGLCAALGRDDWASDGELATQTGRQRRHDELDAGIAEWAAGRDHRDAAQALQASGVPAAPVMANWELVSDPHLFHRQFYVPIEHRDVGVLPFPGPPWKLGRTPGRVFLPAPCFAEHNDYVFRDVLGLDDDAVAGLLRDGVTASEPTPQPVFRAS